MSEHEKQDPLDKLVDAYETMLERVDAALDAAEKKTLPVLQQAFDAARERAVELGELSREEAEKVSDYLRRDMQDAAKYIVETGQDFREWFSFDWQLIETKFYDMFANVADQTRLQLDAWAEQAKRASRYHTGEITGPGTLVCTNCGAELHFKKAGHIPPCHKCRGTEFKRAKAED